MSEAAVIRVLHVDDEPEFCDLAETFLEREDDEIAVETATSAAAALERLAATHVDCVVSDYDMPGQTGIEFLEAVRHAHHELPFILFTGKGSEEIASEAISAGVDDYLQKGGPDRYVLLANRIRNLVERARTRQAVAEGQERFRLLVEESTDVILVVGNDATIRYASPSAEQVLGRTPIELEGTSGFDPIHPDDEAQVMQQFADLVEFPDRRQTVEFRYERPDGSFIWAEARGRNLLDDPYVEGIVVYTRDVTDRRRREERFRAVFEHSPEAMIITDDDGTYVDANPAAMDLLGFGEEDLSNRPVGTLVADAFDYDSVLDDLRAEEQTEGRVPIVRPDGEERRIAYRSTASILDGEHLSILRDVTEAS